MSKTENLFDKKANHDEIAFLLNDKLIRQILLELSYFNQASNPNERLGRVEYVLEFPLVKGVSQFKCTKGFADVIIQAQWIIGDLSKPEKCRKVVVEFLCEVKTEMDLGDCGSILRQLNEYGSYYPSSVQRFSSGLDNLRERYSLVSRVKLCLIVPKISRLKRDFFERNYVQVFDLSELSDNNLGGE